MRINLADSHLFVGWLSVWLFIANVPTEASWPAYSHFLRLFAWLMVWIPPAVVSGIGLRRRSVFLAMVMSIYVIALNFSPFKFEAALMVANIVNALLVVSLYYETKLSAQFLKALDMVLFAWAGMLLVQISIYLPTGKIIDFHSFFFPFSAARYMTAGEDLYRFTGPHIEPGTYCAWTYGLALLRMLLGRRILTPATIVALATLPLTLSVWGVAAGMVFAVSAVMASVSRRQRAWSVGALLMSAGLIFYFYGERIGDIQNYMLKRTTLADASGSSKEWAYTDFYTHFGDYLLWGKNFTYDFCGGCLSPQDAGLGLNLIVYMGFLLTLLVGVLVLRVSYQRGGPALVLFSLLLFFSKYFIWETILWLVVLQAITTKRREARRSGPQTVDSVHFRLMDQYSEQI